jgi:hypothetical protein
MQLARRLIAMKAKDREVVHLYFWNCPMNIFIKLHPELTGIRLWFGNGSPVITYMLVFAGYLAVVTTIAYFQRRLRKPCPSILIPPYQSVKTQADAGSYCLLKALGYFLRTHIYLPPPLPQESCLRPFL